MANGTDFITATIDDYLLSLAEGIQLAQRQLSQNIATGRPGEQPTRYFLPKVDFELRMTVELTNNPQLRSRYAGTAMRSVADAHVIMKPVSTADISSGAMKAEAVSTIRGSFVAVPANEGKPGLIIQSGFTRGKVARTVDVEVTVNNAVGEPQVGLDVEFNVDRELSEAANAEAGSTPNALRPGTQMLQPVVTTDENGRAVATLNIERFERRSHQVVVVLDVAGQTETVHYPVALLTTR